MPKIFDREANTYRTVRLVKNPQPIDDLTEPVWPAEDYAVAEEYYLTRLQAVRGASAEFNISITDKITESQLDESRDMMLFVFDDLLNRFIYFWRMFAYMADNPEESPSSLWPVEDNIDHRAVSQSMVTMYRELCGIQDTSDNLLLDTIRYFMRIAVRRVEMEHPVRRLRHPPMETRVSHVFAVQAIDLFLLRLGIDILRIPFNELVDVGETDFEKEQFSTTIMNFNA